MCRLAGVEHPALHVQLLRQGWARQRSPSFNCIIGARNSCWLDGWNLDSPQWVSILGNNSRQLGEMAIWDRDKYRDRKIFNVASFASKILYSWDF